MSLQWLCLRFEDLDQARLYEIMAARQAVFVVEQCCAFLDLDGVDQDSYHLLGLSKTGELTAYARIVPPGRYYQEASIGRVFTVQSARGLGYGRELIKEAVKRIKKYFKTSSVRISAQSYLERFYHELGFERVSEPYDEDGIPHIEMLK